MLLLTSASQTCASRALRCSRAFVRARRAFFSPHSSFSPLARHGAHSYRTLSIPAPCGPSHRGGRRARGGSRPAAVHLPGAPRFPVPAPRLRRCVPVRRRAHGPRARMCARARRCRVSSAGAGVPAARRTRDRRQHARQCHRTLQQHHQTPVSRWTSDTWQPLVLAASARADPHDVPHVQYISRGHLQVRVASGERCSVYIFAPVARSCWYASSLRSRWQRAREKGGVRWRCVRCALPGVVASVLAVLPPMTLHFSVLLDVRHTV